MKTAIKLPARLLCGMLLLTGFAAQGQVSREYILEHPRTTTAHYSVYPDSVRPQTPAPPGYRPFYLSHYGRHGSRYHTSSTTGRKTLRVLEKSRDLGMLTALGESLCERVARLVADAEGRAGSLSPRGATEHGAIAERMLRNFPEVFAGDARVEARATQSPRSILSMAAGNERLKELNPALRITRCADKGEESFLRNTPYMISHKAAMGRLQADFLRKRLDCTRFACAVFRGDVHTLMNDEELRDFMCGVYAMYCITGCLGHLGVSLDDLFTPGELLVLWQGQNLRNYLQCAASEPFGEGVLADARPLLRDIVSRADAAVAGGDVAADLRFGHDVALAPLIALIRLDDRDAVCRDYDRLHEVWCDFRVMPMAANLQLVFYRSNSTDEILVKLLHNEREGRLPLDVTLFPYYRWNDVRRYFTAILNR